MVDEPKIHNQTNEEPWPSPAYSWYVVGVLTVAYTCSFIDRQILSLLVEPIRRDLQISDTQISLLAGIAFTIFYTLMGVPIAKLSDQKNRKMIIAIGIATWSLMTALCGTARNFWQLFIARIGVGVGEATLSPAAFSILADYFPVNKLARAFSVYSMGVYIGAGLAMIIGGLVVGWVANSGNIMLPVIGEIRPWQTTFFIVGILGLPVLLLMMTVKEPVRRGLGENTAGKNASSTSELLAFIKINRRTLVCHFAAFSLTGIGIMGYLVWTPTVFIRTFGWDAPSIGMAYGTILLVFGTAGLYAGGTVADWLQTKGKTDAIIRSAFYSIIAAIPFAVLTPLMPTSTLAIASLAITTFFFSFPQGLPAAALQVFTPNPLRAQMTAIYFLIGNLIAAGLGPTLFALVTDYIFYDPMMIRYSIAIVSSIVLPMGAIFAFLALKPYRESIRRAQEMTNTSGT